MQERFLTFAQSTCAARVFLNTFGFSLENAANINEFSKIKVFDKSMNVVGKLHFENGKVIIVVNYDNSLLVADYDIPKVSGFVDKESGGALFGEWFNKIAFRVKNGSTIRLSGELLIECSIDSKFGSKCRCHPVIECEVPNKGKITLKILRDFKLFSFEISSDNYNETIDIMPWNDYTGFIKHVITYGKYDSKNYINEYKKYMGVFSAGKGNEDKLHAFLSETEWDKQISFRNEFIPKAGDDNSKELLIQKGMIMHDLDPDMFEKIKSLRKVFSINDISLLDNLFTVCYERYSDEEVQALLGIKRVKMNYQDGADNLKESYFRTGNGNYFLDIIEQKKLLKTDRNNL